MLRKVALHLGLIVACLVVILPPLSALRTSLVPESLSYSTAFFPDWTW